jgi:hypothetical protein
MRDIPDLFASKPQGPLYHYTGIGSLLGISRTKSLWASNVYYMNDSKEVIHACDVLNGVLESLQIFDPNEPEEDFLRQLKDWGESFRRETYNLFVFSLSEEPSLLSQWRSYTPHGKGVSIGLSPETLKRLLQHGNVRLAKCIYEKGEQEDLLYSLIGMMLTTFKQKQPEIDITKAHPSQCYHPFLEEFRGDFLQVLSIIKHGAFREEKEWRLISSYYPNYTLPDIKFREGASMLVPYLELPLGENKPYFQEIILGPSPHERLSLSALSMFLSNQKLCNKTGICDIPYREW